MEERTSLSEKESWRVHYGKTIPTYDVEDVREAVKELQLKLQKELNPFRLYSICEECFGEELTK